MFTPNHRSHVRCHVCGVMFCFFWVFFWVFLQSGGDSRWRVCYQRGLPRLVLRSKLFSHYLQESFHCSRSQPYLSASKLFLPHWEPIQECQYLFLFSSRPVIKDNPPWFLFSSSIWDILVFPLLRTGHWVSQPSKLKRTWGGGRSRFRKPPVYWAIPQHKNSNQSITRCMCFIWPRV